MTSGSGGGKPGGGEDKRGSWITSGGALLIVVVAVVVVLVILIMSLVILQQGAASRNGELGVAVANPNAGTIVALASAAFAALMSLVSTYFGIRAVTEQSDQTAGAIKASEEANQIAADALKVNQAALDTVEAFQRQMGGPNEPGPN